LFSIGQVNTWILRLPKIKPFFKFIDNFIFINIFGGILRCDTLAKGLIEAISEVEVKLPLVIRMEGTNVEQGRKLLNESGLKLIVASTMQEAAQKVIAAIRN